jgi:hypothetical protein
MRPARNLGHNSPEITNAGLFEDAAVEAGTDDALADESLAYRQLTSGMEESHSGTGAGATGGPIDGTVSESSHIAREQATVGQAPDRSVKLYRVYR